jgi:mRNA interferase MazF
MRVRRGDVFLASLDPTVGAEQAGTRPVLVVQCNPANDRIPTVTVVPLTSNLRAGRFLFTVTVSTTESGLPKDSVILVFHVRTLDKARLIHRIGHLEPQTMTQVDEALALHLGLSSPQ